MCRLLVDAMVWNYVAKAGVLPGFLASLSATPTTLTEVVQQLKPALGRWPELGAVMIAARNDEIDEVELDQEEEGLRIEFLTRFPGLGVVDCGLLSVASRRKLTLVTCDQALQKVAAKMSVKTVALESLLGEAVENGSLSSDDRRWVTKYSRGHTGHRES